jgi:hypothetical protein
MAKRVSLTEIHRQLIEVCGNVVTRVQHVRKWYGAFVNGRKDVHDEDHTSGISTTRQNANAAQTEEMTVESR